MGEGVLIAGAMGATMGGVMSALLHRDRTHGSVEMHPLLERAGEVVTHALSGMDPMAWTAVHVTHHAYQDFELPPDKLAAAQKKYPGAPKEAFRDAHSPILEGKYGHLKIIALNGIKYYPKAARALKPYLIGLEADKVPRSDWPPQFRPMKVEQSRYERTIDKIPHGRMLGLVATAGAITAVRGPKVAAAAMAVYIPGILALGGGVNSLGHTGQVKNERERLRVVLGKQPAVPDTDGLYSSNFFPGIVGVLTAGEADHGNHHKDPSNPFISGMKWYRDPVGVGLRWLGRAGLVSFPTRNPE